MCPKFQVYRDTAGKTRFRLRADNNQIIAVGEAYAQHDGCIKGLTGLLNSRSAPIEDLTTRGSKRNGPNPKFEVYYDSEGKFRFRVIAANGEIAAVGEAYESKSACFEGIELVRCCYAASVEDPFVTEVVICSELPRIPDITIDVVKPAGAVIRLGDEAPVRNQMGLPVVSLLTLLGFEFVFGLSEGVLKAVGKSREATVGSAAASSQ
jgi:uncharacterized protein YegP (UPF0339 family)